jgi:hypothetical protein
MRTKPVPLSPSSCLTCVNVALNTSEECLYTITEDDADVMDAISSTRAFLPLALDNTSPPTSASAERDQLVIHQDYPCMEATCFGTPRKEPWPAISYTYPDGVHRIRSLASEELLHTFRIPVVMQDAYACSGTSQENVALRLSTYMPLHSAIAFYESLLNQILSPRQDPDDTSIMQRSASGMVATVTPTQDAWAAAYDNDPECKFMIENLTTVWTAQKVREASPCYRQALLQGEIQWLNKRLCISYVVEQKHHRLLLIIAPRDLWNVMFLAYHAAPSCGHMGRYKTLYRLRQQFFWDGMRKYVEDQIASYPHCILSNSTKDANSDLMFSWPLDCPFTTIHCGLWSAGELEANGSQLHMVTAMCDMTQFVVTTPANSTLASDLSPLFMQDVLLEIGFCVVVAIDEGSTFKGAFRDMCHHLKIRYHTIARANHKALAAERFHRFLNKSVTIATNDRQQAISSVVIPACHLAAYAWNSAPIDGTGVIHSVCVVGREFKLPFDFEYTPNPGITTNNATSVH